MKTRLIEATRTKALGLMHKATVQRTRLDLAQEYRNIFWHFAKTAKTQSLCHIKTGLNTSSEKMSQPTERCRMRWRRYASPVWMDINFSNTLNAKTAREAEDERHVCPMSLDLIEQSDPPLEQSWRCCFRPIHRDRKHWLHGDQAGRKFVGSELKSAYFTQAVKNIGSATTSHGGLFSTLAINHNEQAKPNNQDRERGLS